MMSSNSENHRQYNLDSEHIALNSTEQLTIHLNGGNTTNYNYNNSKPLSIIDDNDFDNYLHNQRIYVNLCRHCNSPTVDSGDTVSESVCLVCLANNSVAVDQHIYENVCEICGSIFSGIECGKCNQLSGNKVDTKSRRPIFARFFDSLRGRGKLHKGKRPKLEILHNVDGFDNVFHTNQILDFKAICHLKQRPASEHIYGKLRLSAETLSPRPLIGIQHSVVNAASESTLPQLRNQCNQSHYSPTSFFTKSSPNLLTHSNRVTQHCNDVSARVRNCLVTDRKCLSYTDFTNDASVLTWMTSLRIQPVEYSDIENVSVIKSIPSKHFSYCTVFDGVATSCSLKPIQVSTINNSRIHCGGGGVSDYCGIDLIADNYNRRMFETSVVESQSKRRAIYVRQDDDDRNCLYEPLLSALRQSQENVNTSAVNSAADSEFVRGLMNIFDSYMYGKYQLSKSSKKVECSENVNQIVEPTIAIIPSKNSISKNKKKFGKQRLKNWLSNHFLSIGLNRLLLTYDKELGYVLSILSDNNNKYSQKYFTTDKYTFISRLLQQFGEACQAFDVIKREQLKLNQVNEKSIVDVSRRNIEREALSSTTPSIGTGNISDIFIEPLQTMAKESLEDGLKCEHVFKAQTISELSDSENQQSSDTYYSSESTHTMDAVAAWNDSQIVTNHDEDIYQPIWKFRTVGTARESYASEYGADNNTCNAVSEMNNEEIDEGEWEVDEEFMFSAKFGDDSGLTDQRSATPNSSSGNSFSTSISGSVSCSSEDTTKSVLSAKKLNSSNLQNECDPYQRICILYNLSDVKLNRIIYNYNSQTSVNYWTPVVGGNSDCNSEISRQVLSKQNGGDGGGAGEHENANAKKNKMMPDCVQAWKFMLLNVNYIEDEEDMNIPETFQMSTLLAKADLEDQQLISGGKYNDIVTQPTSQTTSLAESTIPESKTKGFIASAAGKFQFGRLDISNSQSPKSNELCLKSYKQVNSDEKQVDEQPAKEKIPTPLPIQDDKKYRGLTYGVELDRVEKDDNNPLVPKFVVECIKMIEQDENIRTNGIYRASGNKNSIENVKKKMNERAWRKDSKYSMLHKQDVHTLTGALKQFFRELKTDLIPIEIVHSLPSERLDGTSLPQIKTQVSAIERCCRETLKHLIHHLTIVDRYSGENLMNASNLSIVWGACIFNSTAHTFETSDIMKKNSFINILITNYKDIFENQ